MRELGWNEIPRAHEIHQHLMENAPDVDWSGNGNPVYFKADDADTGCWETVLIPKDCVLAQVMSFTFLIEWKFGDTGNAMAALNMQLPSIGMIRSCYKRC